MWRPAVIKSITQTKELERSGRGGMSPSKSMEPLIPTADFEVLFVLFKIGTQVIRLLLVLGTTGREEVTCGCDRPRGMVQS